MYDYNLLVMTRDYFNAVCRLCEIKFLFVQICFGVMYIIDDGKSMLSQAGRVHTEYERQGNFKQLSQYCNSAAKEYGCSRRVALVETTLNQYARSERFRKTHKDIATKVTLLCTTIHRYPIFSTRYSLMCKVYTGYCGTSEIEHGLCACTFDNPLAKARGLSLRTGAQTMLYLSHIELEQNVIPSLLALWLFFRLLFWALL